MPEYFPSSNIARPWYGDRSAVPTASGYSAGSIAPHGATTRWTYTVPSGKKAYIETCFALSMRDAVATTAVDHQCSVDYTPNGGAAVNILRVLARDANVTGSLETLYSDSLGAVALMVAGDAIAGATSDNSTGGSVTYVIASKRTEFDV